MRYTTIIDITEQPDVYRNVNARLLYLHMALKAGYHDDDRDRLHVSLRNLAAAVGLTLSATRHALKVLEAAKLVSKVDNEWSVLKFVIADVPSPRRQPTKAEREASKPTGRSTPIGEQMDKEAADYRQRLTNAVREMTKEEIAIWIEELSHGKNIKHHGAYLNPNQRNIAWLMEVLKAK